MEFKLNMDNLELFTKEEIARRSKLAVQQQLNSMFNDSFSYHHGQQKMVREQGVVSLVIGEMITKKLSDVKIQKFIDDYIDKELDNHMKQALEKACQHAANKAVFSKLKGK